MVRVLKSGIKSIFGNIHLNTIDEERISFTSSKNKCDAGGPKAYKLEIEHLKLATFSKPAHNEKCSQQVW